MGNKGDSTDREIARIATRQHGIVTHRQLRDAGLSRPAITKRAQRGRLHRLHQGVYAVGYVGLSIEARWIAAVLASGSGAALSHGSAAALWGLLRPISGPVDVSVPTQTGRRPRSGIRLHRCASLDPDQVTGHRGIRVTTPVRTIADLRGAVSPRLVRHATRQAEMLGLPLGIESKTDRTRSDLERDFLWLCHRHGLPEPQVNVRIGRWTVDFLWPAERLVVETDSYRWHRGGVAFEDDHVRDLDLRRRGYAVRRFTGRQIRDEVAQVVDDLRDGLSCAS